MTTLAALCHQTRITPLDHLEHSLTIPVVDGLQAQGDLLIIPFGMVADALTFWTHGSWLDVPPEGVELLRSQTGGNPHVLVADPGTCRWTRQVSDAEGLALGVFSATAPAYLLHPEHGASGCTPGLYVVRRQREGEQRMAPRLIAD